MRRRWRPLLGVTLMASGLGIGAWPSAAAADVRINGSGTYSIDQLVIPWSTDLFEAPTKLQFGYRTTGTYVAFDQLAKGQIDYAVGAADPRPGQFDAAAATIVKAPIRADAQALVAMFGRNGLLTLSIGSDEDEDGEPDVTTAPYAGPVRLEPAGVAAAYSFPPGTGTIWGVPGEPGVRPEVPMQFAFELADGESITKGDFSAPAAAVVRGDPSSSNLYMQQYVESKLPALWRSFLADRLLSPESQPNPEWLFPNAPGRRSGTTGQLQILRELRDPSTTNSGTNSGVFALVPISAATVELAANRATRTQEAAGARTAGDLRVIELRNGAGEWVAPTEESILTAIEAGNGTALYGLEQPVPGAWPLAHLDYLYAPSSGLTPDKTNGVAALIRYAVTSGQDHVQPLGTPRLPQRHVAEALQVANDLVTSNCTQAGYEVREGTDPGPLLPTDIVVPGPVRHCVQSPAARWPDAEISIDDGTDADRASPPSTTVPATVLARTTTTTATTTTTTTTTTTRPAASSSSQATSPRQTASAAPAATGATAATAAAATTTTTRPASVQGPSPSAPAPPIPAPTPPPPLIEPTPEDADLASAGEDAAAVPDDRLVALRLPMALPESERSDQHRVATMFMGAGLVTVGNDRWRRYRDRRRALP